MTFMRPKLINKEKIKPKIIKIMKFLYLLVGNVVL